MSHRPDIAGMFNEIVSEHFNGEFPDVEIAWSNRLRTTAGRAHWVGSYNGKKPTKVELSDKLFRSLGWPINEIREVLIHEMVHAWLIYHYNDGSHGSRFQRKMNEIVGWRKSHTYHSLDTSATRNKRTVVVTCLDCGSTFNRSRMPNRKKVWFHKGCGGILNFERIKAHDPTSVSIFGHNPSPPVRVAASRPEKPKQPKSKRLSVSIFEEEN